MKFYLAPMEGLTGYIYRNAYQKYFHDIDKFFTPFIANKKLSNKEIREISPENNPGMKVVPQILTNRAEDFIEVTKEIQTYGYDEVNLNLGCPSGTVVAKRRGAGFLALPDELDAFLQEIFDGCNCKISIKTRVGKETPDEWEDLLAIYNKYPLEELIVHPRIQKDFYKYQPRLDCYEYAVKNSQIPLCYNGDIHSIASYEKLVEQFPGTDRIMLGRGMMKNPGLAGELKGNEKITKDTLHQFHDELYHGYRGFMSGDRNTLYKMKEIWSYMGDNFIEPEKYLKKIRKTNHLTEYDAIVSALFQELELK